MKYIKNDDYNYIINKYHDTDEPFDSLKRFVRNDKIFDSDSGLEPDKITSDIIQNDKLYSSLPHPIRKARALEYVLDHTRISCSGNDIFPAINMIDRPITKTIVSPLTNEIFREIIPEIAAERSRLERLGIAVIYPDYDHSVPDWERLLSLGFSGLLRESEEERGKKTLTPEKDAFYEGIKITYEAALRFIDRLRALAEKTEGSEKLAAALRVLGSGAPTTFYEALLLSYLYFMISEHIDCLQVRSLSNFDRVFYRYYRHDLEIGYSEEDIRRELAYYFLQFTAIGNYWNQPVYLGGENGDGSTVINELSYLFLDVYDEMGIYNPKIQIKISKSTPEAFTLRALDMVRRGHNCIVFVSDATVRRALEIQGVTPDDARECNITGCYEYSPKDAFVTGMNYLSLLKPLEILLYEGRDGITGESIGLTPKPLEEIDSFDTLFAEYKRYLKNSIDLSVNVILGFEDYLADMNPLSLLSATQKSCIISGRDAIAGGCRTNGTNVQFGYLADTVDSLAMIKKYVFERGEVSLSEFAEILDGNFEGHELFRKKLLSDRDKWGNNRELPDKIAVEISRLITDSVSGRPNSPLRGGTFSAGFHVARMSYTEAKRHLASANGRLIGEELSKNVSACMGQQKEGATAAILSALKIDFAAVGGDGCLDLGLLPSAVKGDDGLSAMLGLLSVYMNNGGHAMHINVFDADRLKDAQLYPEKYEDLQIRVCGWNVLWNNIKKEEQNGFIRQAESLI